VAQHFLADLGTSTASLRTFFAVLMIVLSALFRTSQTSLDTQFANLLDVRAFT
jgi:hypothetical protein